jgi:hypothetical protein
MFQNAYALMQRLCRVAVYNWSEVAVAAVWQHMVSTYTAEERAAPT